jgi:preprotein translocase subunit SecA
MLESIKEESVGYLFNLEVQVESETEGTEEGATPPILVAQGLVTPQRSERLQYSAPSVDEEGGVETHAEGESSASPRDSGNNQGGSRAERRARRKRG